MALFIAAKLNNLENFTILRYPCISFHSPVRPTSAKSLKIQIQFLSQLGLLVLKYRLVVLIR